VDHISRAHKNKHCPRRLAAASFLSAFAAADPRQLFDDESKNLGLDDRFKDLLGRFVRSRPQAPTPD
jgi:hypothetical protein